MTQETVAQSTYKYIGERPGVRDCLQRGLINYSALARLICRELEITQFDGVLVACRRFAERSKRSPQHEDAIRMLMSRARLRVRSRIAVAILEKSRDLEGLLTLERTVKARRGDFNLIEGESVCTVVLDAEFLPIVRDLFPTATKKITEGLCQITLMFDEGLETTSGVVSHVYGLLAAQGINVLEEMSCWTDIMIVVRESDLARTVSTLATEGAYEDTSR